MDPKNAQMAVKAAPALLPLFRIGVAEYYDTRRMEKAAEQEVRIAELRQERQSRPPRANRRESEPRAREPEPAPEPEPEGLAVDVTPLIEGETCEMCRAIVDHIQELPMSKRAVGLAEYGKMKQAIEADAGKDEVAVLIEKSEVLSEIINDGLAV